MNNRELANDALHRAQMLGYALRGEGYTKAYDELVLVLGRLCDALAAEQPATHTPVPEPETYITYIVGSNNMKEPSAIDEIDAADEARSDVIATVLQIIHEWETKANNYDRTEVAYTLSLLSEDIKRRFEVEDRDDLNAALNVALTLPRDGTVDLADVKREFGVEE